MLINKLLNNYNYIIPRSIESNYLTYLIDLKIYPIVELYNEYSSYPVILKHYRHGYSFNEINIRPLNIEEIKDFLYRIKHITEAVYGINADKLFISLPTIWVKRNIL